MTGLPTIFTYGLLALLWGAILVLYLRGRRTARARDPLVAMLLGVLALDAFKSVVESAYFGLVWGVQYGVLGGAMSVLSRPGPLTAVKWLNVGVALTVLTQLVRKWVPSELAERERQRASEADLRARLEESLRAVRESEERFQLAADASQQGVWEVDLRTGTMWLSRKFGDFIGSPGDRLDPAEWIAAVHPDDVGHVRARMEAAKASETRYTHRYRVRHRDGTWRLIQGHGMVLRDAYGSPVRLLGVSRDVTAETAAEEASRQTQKLESLGLLAAGVAHDFNNLLTVITTNVSMLEEGARPADRESIDAAMQAARRAATLTHQLLAYGGKASFARKPVDVTAVVSDMSQLLQTVISRKVKRVDRLARVSPVAADPAQLQQVVMNLVTNAAEAIGDAPGAITLETGEQDLDLAAARAIDPGGTLQPGRCVYFSVCDTGSGMSPETLSRIFDPFFTTKATGRGLGLSAMAGIVRAHGGAVTIQSEPGKGSTFRVFLPALEAKVVEESVPPQVTAARMSGTVLLVDDEPILRRSAARMLRLLGLDVVEAANGAEAVALVERGPHAFNVVLMDLMMPEMGGLEALSKIRAIRDDLPVILTSGYSSTPFKAEPGTTFLPKPFDGAQMANALRQTGAIG